MEHGRDIFQQPGKFHCGTIPRWWATVIVVLILCAATAAWAQERPYRMRMTEPGRDDPNGLRLSEVLAKGLFGLAKEVITQAITGEGIAGQDALPSAPEAPPRGLQVDLFTPETIGVTVHYHW